MSTGAASSGRSNRIGPDCSVILPPTLTKKRSIVRRADDPSCRVVAEPRCTTRRASDPVPTISLRNRGAARSRFRRRPSASANASPLTSCTEPTSSAALVGPAFNVGKIAPMAAYNKPRRSNTNGVIQVRSVIWPLPHSLASAQTEIGRSIRCRLNKSSQVDDNARLQVLGRISQLEFLYFARRGFGNFSKHDVTRDLEFGEVRAAPLHERFRGCMLAMAQLHERTR